MNSSGYDSRLRKITLIGIIVILLFFGVLGGWATFSKLNSAAIAIGELGFDTDRQTIQHLEGGIVTEILVKDGDLVEASEVLMRLDQTQSQAVFEQVNARYLAILATEARLIAERDKLNEIIFPSILDNEAIMTNTSSLVLSETRLFKSRSMTVKNRLEIIQQGILQLEEEIEGLSGEFSSQGDQIALLQEEIDAMQLLFDQKLVSKERLLTLQRAAAALEGERSGNRAEIARARQRISEEELRAIEVSNDRDTEVVTELRGLQAELLELNELLSATQDVLNRTNIIAPIRGTIVDLAVSTVGGVIGSRQALMDIVPLDEKLLIRARLELKDIDTVKAGQAAFVRFTAYNQRNLLPIEAVVTSVSADSLIDEQTGARYYLVRIELPDINDSVFQNIELYPGMQAEVMIQIAERTPLNYLLQPVLDSMNRALRED